MNKIITCERELTRHHSLETAEVDVLQVRNRSVLLLIISLLLHVCCSHEATDNEKLSMESRSNSLELIRLVQIVDQPKISA